MNAEYKDKFLCALNQQKNNSETIGREERYQQVLDMNGLTKLKPISLTELLFSGGRKKPDSCMASAHDGIYKIL